MLERHVGLSSATTTVDVHGCVDAVDLGSSPSAGVRALLHPAPLRVEDKATAIPPPPRAVVDACTCVRAMTRRTSAGGGGSTRVE
jgi:hypothetical protein